ncbi:hypothetical protein [Clostridium sp. HBUAS56010]|uniref:hypothetical protein n=1 Tax=Clostridium sp. HBUAS56010 TaxID=2571127 RepID=UPI0011784407|nr:hypothetical protein [Clostridium sp. HBUAS56010]
MNDKFTVINNDRADQKKLDHVYKVAKLNELWDRQRRNATLQAIEKNKGKEFADFLQEDLMKIALCGVKYICSHRDVKRENTQLSTGYKQSLEESKILFQLIDGIFAVCGYLQLKNFVTTFPITKEYDGEKWECKDYFFTMNVLSEMDWDKPVGREKISDLLWDYQNDDLRHVYVEYTSAMSDIYRSQTGKGMMESFFEKEGIGTHTLIPGKNIMKDNSTGGIMKICDKPSHLKIVK